MDANILPLERHVAQKYWTNSTWTTYVEIPGKYLICQADISVWFRIFFPGFISLFSRIPLWHVLLIHLKRFTSVLVLVMGFPSLQACVKRFPKCPIHYKYVCNIHLGWQLSPCQRLYIIQASYLATIAYHLALSMSVTASSANNIGSVPLNTDELKNAHSGELGSSNKCRVGEKPTVAGRKTGAWNKGLKTRKPLSDHRRHALHSRPDSSDKTLVMYYSK